MKRKQVGGNIFKDALKLVKKSKILSTVLPGKFGKVAKNLGLGRPKRRRATGGSLLGTLKKYNKIARDSKIISKALKGTKVGSLAKQAGYGRRRRKTRYYPGSEKVMF